MPQVPKYNSGGVNQTAIQGIRTNVNAPGSAFGQGIDKQAEALGNLNSDVSKVLTSEAISANQMANRKLQNDLDKFHVDQYAEGGVFRSQGLDAFTTAPEKFKENFNKKKEELLSQASNDEQRAFLEQASNTSYNNLNKTLQAHMNAERQKYGDSLTKNSVELSSNLIETHYNDPQIINGEVAKMTKALEQNLLEKNVPPEERAAAITKARSQALYRAVERRVVNKDIAGAEAYYKANKALFEGKETETEKLFKDGKEENKLASGVYNLVEKYNDYGAAFAAARKMYSPEEVAKMDSLLKTKMHDKNTQVKQEYETKYATALSYLRNSKGDISAVPVSITAGLMPEHQEALKETALVMKGVNPRQNDPIPYNMLMNMSGEDLARMTPTEVSRMTIRLSPENEQRILTRRSAAMKGLNGEDPGMYELKNLDEERKLMFDEMKASKIISTDKISELADSPKDLERMALAEDQYNSLVKQRAIETGGKVPNDEKRKIARSIINQKIKTQDWLGFSEKDEYILKLDGPQEVKVRDLDYTKYKDMAIKAGAAPATISDSAFRKKFEAKIQNIIYNSNIGKYRSTDEVYRELRRLE